GLNSYAGTSDTYLYTSTGIPQNVDKSTSTTLLAGEDGTGGQAQLLVKFDVSQIPVGSTINSVTLTMQITSANMFTSASFGLHRMLVNWSETSTWTTMGDGISDGTEASLTTDSSITEGGAGSYTFASSTNMKNTVQGWVNGSTNNYGWYFTAGGYQSRNTFASSEHATTTYRPTLTIDYTAPAPPTLDLDANNSSGATGSGYNGAFVENGAAVKIADTDATFTAGSSSTLSSMTVTISNLLNGTAESLDATTTGSITKSYDSATGVLTLSGTDTLANYQTVLRSITYNNTSDTPNTTNRTINVVATDPYAQTVSASSTLTVTATNDAPVITSNGGGATASVSVAETLTAVTTVTSTDPEGTARTYSIVAGGDGTKFSINSSTGVLTFVSAPDYEAPTDSDANNSYLVTVQASDGSLSDTQLITVTVTDVVSTLTVTTVADTNDTGLGSSFTAEQLNASKGSDSQVSLREAIIAANTTAGTDTINFAITGTAGTYGEYTIATSSALPTITQAVIINGASQTGYTNRPLVVLDGAGGGAYGLELSNTSDGSTIRGLLIRDFSSYGIYIPSGSDNQTIVGNFIGSFNADGSNAGVGKGNSVAGIYTRGANTLIGGTTAADRNVISGNGSYNIYLTTDADGSTIRGNYIGTNSAGSAVFSTTNPDYGIMVETSASNITIGGTASGAGNVISGHQREGVWVTTTGSVTLQGNYIGTDATGTVDLGNTRYGIYLDDTGSATIGGTTAGAGNVISGNNLGGIYASNGSIILQGNTIGLNAAGTAALGNTGIGVELRTSNASTLGGNTAAARNIISGNSSHGIQVETSKAHTI
ncbi:MAG TPA: DNRLRE domain-containing protein, partial [Aquabacterium sp.]|nr:DNRLRE domain-containing protein [Aquabacterium sp.]